MNKKVLSLKKYTDIIILLIISILFSYGFFLSINILFYDYGFDASCFYTIGRAILDGKMPYIDFVDNKGPVTYLLYAVSALFGQFPNGIFVISCLFLFISLVLIWFMCAKLNIKYKYCVIFSFLALYACLCKGGYTEDFAVPFVLFAYNVLLLFIEKQNGLYGLAISILFWLCAMTRLNNAVPIGAIVLCIGIKLIIDKDWKNLLKYICSALAGSVICIVPITVWLYKKGALMEWLNQSFLNNFKYNAASTAISKDVLFIYSRFGVIILCSVIISILVCVYTAYHDKGKKFLSITFCVSMLITAASYYAVTQDYKHYLTSLLVPSFFCIVILMLAESSKTKLFDNLLKIALIVSLCFLYTLNSNWGFGDYLSGAGRIKCLVTNPSSAFENSFIKQSVEKITDNIPENERDSVFSIEITPCVYAFSQITPCKRLFVCSDLFVDISDEYADEFEGYFENEPPKWLMTGNAIEDIDICGLKNKLTSMYSLKDSECINMDGYEMLYLYELK